MRAIKTVKQQNEEEIRSLQEQLQIAETKQGELEEMPETELLADALHTLKCVDSYCHYQNESSSHRAKYSLAAEDMLSIANMEISLGILSLSRGI